MTKMIAHVAFTVFRDTRSRSVVYGWLQGLLDLGSTRERETRTKLLSKLLVCEVERERKIRKREREREREVAEIEDM